MAIEQIIKEIYAEIEKLRISSGEGEYIYCFRGESADYKETKLIPTLFRDSRVEGKLPDRELINLITDYQIADATITSNLSKAIEGQHFLVLSRLLDITFSIMPALYFACSGNYNEDGYIYIFRFPTVFSPSSTYINFFYDGLISGEIEPYFNNFKVLTHTQSNERIKSQSGGFILFPGKTAIPIPERYYLKLKVSKEKKKDVLNELDLYFGINEAFIYPEKDKKRELISKKISMISKESNCVNTDALFYKIEIEEALERIQFELRVMLNEGKSKKEQLRLIRKEERDILEYLDRIEHSKKWDNEQAFKDLEQETQNILEKLKEYVNVWIK